jgi:hypothetical protein
MMRSLSVLACFGVALLLSACADSKWGFLRKNNNEAPSAAANLQNPTAVQLVAYLDGNSRRIQSLQCGDVDMDIKMKQSFGIQGWLACQKPRSFRMRARAIGNDEADIGSNTDEFWYWIARSQPPYLVHCSYQDLARGVEVPFPFRPEWVMEALGMGEYGSPDGYRIEPGPGVYKLVLDTTSPQGQPMRKITVFNSARARTQVTDHILQDVGGRTICSAHIDDVQVVDGAIVPKKIILSWPGQDLRLTMKLYDVKLNLPLDNNQALFNRPAITGVQSVDLGRRTLDSAPLQAAGGYSR